MFMLPDVEKKSSVKSITEVLPSMKMPKGSRVAVEQSLLVAHPRVQGQELCVVDTILLCLARSLTGRHPLKECNHWAGYIPYNELVG